MKKTKKTMLTAALLAAAANLTACTLPWQNDDEVQTVYGPPSETAESFSETDSDSSSESSSEDKEESSSLAEQEDSYDPEDDDVQDVYGPPPFEDEEETEDSYDPEEDQELNQTVYGPPPEELDSYDPVISIILGEGGSGGALALAVCDELAMLENAIYSVISPRGFASILWKDASREREACDIMKVTAEDLVRLKVCDRIIQEAEGGAHNDPQQTAEYISEYISESLQSLQNKFQKGLDEMINRRYNKFRVVGEFQEPPQSDMKAGQ